MKNRVQTALVSAALSIIAHVYLTLHYYPLKFGFAAGQSLCNLSAKFDCDAVSASAYSSFLGIPMSLWGGATNGVIFVLILLGWLEWTENPERTRRWALALTGFSFLTSVTMGGISLFLLHNYCVVCMGLYVLSAVIFFAYAGVLKEPFWMHIRRDLPLLGTEARGNLIAIGAIPLIAYLGHQMFMQNLGDVEVTHMIRSAVAEWESAPKNVFVAKPSLTMGPSSDQATMVLTEFADFRCGHCKHASYSLDAFVKSHPDVRFEFYSFPLDGACNEKIESSSGISCLLAEAVYCAEKDGKGWALHHALYEAQDQINQTAAVPEASVLLSKIVSDAGLNWESVEHCTKDPGTVDAIKAQAKQGALVNVMGTPTLFADGKHLNRGQLVPVLESVREKIQQSKVKDLFKTQ